MDKKLVIALKNVVMDTDSKFNAMTETIKMVMDVTKTVKSRKDIIAKVDHQSNLVHAFHISLTDLISQQLVQFTYSEELFKDFV